MFGMVNRRDFLKGSGALLAALSLSSWFPLARRAASQSCPAPATYGFNCLPTQLATGQPIADIGAGWDGTQWAIDSLGVPHLFDPIQQVWAPFGAGVDAATLIGDAMYLFRGAEVAVYNLTAGQATVQAIAQAWPDLPPSFTGDLEGAWAQGSTLYLCRSGRYVFADLTVAPVTFSPPAALNNWSGWPGGDPWGQGVVGKAGSWVDPTLPAFLAFPTATPPTAFLLTFLVQGGAVNVDPISALGNTIPPAASQVVNLLTAGAFDAYVTQTNNTRIPNNHWIFQGPILWTQTNTDQNEGATTPTALGTWAPDWFPVLAQAPRGRVGNLWSVTTGGDVVFHDGEAWSTAPGIPGATVQGVDVGEDGVPFALATGGSAAAVYQYDAEGGAWLPPVALGSITPAQLAVGDASRVYVRGADGAVSRLVNGAFVPVGGDLQAGVAHMAVNHDGTLWHCDGSTPNAYRYISEQPYQAAIPIANVTSVQKLASTAYGNAMLLTVQAGAQQLYRYASPALFKTSPSFIPIADGPVLQNPQVAAGGGRCFVNLGHAIAALDGHTGEELWLAAAPNGGSFAAMTYDPLLRLLYATDTDVTLVALDVTTGSEVWSYAVASAPISQPAVRGTGLGVVGNAQVYWFDTRAALAAATSNPAQAVTPVWSVPAVTPPGIAWAALTIDANFVTVTLQASGTPVEYITITLATQDGSMLSNGIIEVQLAQQVTPLVGCGEWQGNWQTLSVINSGFGIWAFPAPFLAGSATHLTAAPAGSGGLARGVALFDGMLYAGGANGILYALSKLDGSASFQQLTQSNITDGAFAAGPVAVPDGKGGAAIVFSGKQGSANALWIYDPVTGNLTQIDTDQLLVTQLAFDTNGMLYAAGNPGTSFGQVYALRVDTILQQERDFIVESELMQDFDEPATGQLTATARYQTHVTVVDAIKAPQPFQAVKVWMDTDTLTLVQIDGVPQFINATTPARVQTDAAGSFTIVSDATDLSTPALKLWATFMNPGERIVAYPDRAFHLRLQTTVATPGATNPDPTNINLATATTYDVANLTNPPTLFAAAEQAQASAAAGAIQQLTSAVAYQKGVTPAAAASAGSYLAYTDLAGAAYGPVNTPANRLVTALAVNGATGFSFDGSTVTPLSVVDAANAIDALEGAPPGEPGSVLSWLRKLWAKIKGGVATVVQIVVSVGKELYLGLKYLEAGAAKVLRQALRDVEDVAIAIGSVFVQLGKDIVKAAEALSIIFHLGEVVATARQLKAYFTTWANDLPQTIGAVSGTIQQELASLENTITTDLQALIAYFDNGRRAGAMLSATPAIQDMQGVGQSPHTAFTVAPKAGGSARPVAVPAMWGAHKLRHHLGQAGSQAAPGAGAPDFVGTFLAGFISDPGLKQALANARQQFDDNFHPASAKAFFGGLIGDLLSLIEVIAALAVDGIRAGVNAVLDNLAATAAALLDWGNAEIPVISKLLELLGLKDITFLDIIVFVAAIPTTLVYRIVYGAYPSAGETLSAVGDAALAKVVGIMSGVLNIVNGIFAAIADADATAGEPVTGVEATVKRVVSIILCLITSATYIAGSVAAPTAWVIIGSVVNILQALFGLWSPSNEDAPSLEVVPSIFGALMATPLLLLAYVEQWKGNQDALNLASGVVSTLALFVNPLKFSADLAAVALVSDIVSGVASGYLTLIDTLADAPPPTGLPVVGEPGLQGTHRLFMPALQRP